MTALKAGPNMNANPALVYGGVKFLDDFLAARHERESA
jgi:hypothetical protein